MDIPSADLALSFVAPTIVQTTPKEPPSSNLALSSSAPTVAQSMSAAISVPSGNLALTGHVPNVRFVVQWSQADAAPLCPTDITVELSTETRSGGRSITGKKQGVQSDAGFWRIVVTTRIRNNSDVLTWRARQLQLNGRANTILVPLVDRKRAPIPPGGAPIIASADDPVSRGAVSMNLKMTQGAEPEPGQHFSTATGEAYRIRTVGMPTGSPPVYPITFRPPARVAIADNEAMEFDHPVCRCRLERDDAMNIDLQLMLLATPEVAFVEDY